MFIPGLAGSSFGFVVPLVCLLIGLSVTWLFPLLIDHLECLSVRLSLGRLFLWLVGLLVYSLVGWSVLPRSVGPLVSWSLCQSVNHHCLISQFLSWSVPDQYVRLLVQSLVPQLLRWPHGQCLVPCFAFSWSVLQLVSLSACLVVSQTFRWSLCHLIIGPSVGQSLGQSRSVGLRRFIPWFVNWSHGRSIHHFVSWLVPQFVGSSVSLLACRLIGQLLNRSACW